VIKGVIEHAVANDLSVDNSDEAITGGDFTADKVSPLFLSARDEVE
jgi:hypothetical protein